MHFGQTASAHEYIPTLAAQSRTGVSSAPHRERKGNVMKELGKLFEHTLMDIYYAENQILQGPAKTGAKGQIARLEKGL